MKKLNKNQQRSLTWNKCIKLKKKQYDFICEKREEFEFKTLAGTLDKILNDYKNICQ